MTILKGDSVASQRESKAEPEKRQERRGLDPEIQAMAKLDRIMSELPPNCAGRVLLWLSSRYAALRTQSRPADLADKDAEF